MGHRNRTTRRTLGTVLLSGGLLILLGAAAYFGWTQLQAAQVRAALAARPTATAVIREAQTALPTVTATATATAIATPTALPPTPTETPAAASTAVPTVDAPSPTAVATATPVPPQPVAPVAAPGSGRAGSPVRLAIPDLKVDTTVVPMGWEVIQTASGPRSEWVIPKNEAGHHINSALLGQNDNLVISGHNNIYGMVFKPISLAWDNDARLQVDAYTDRSEILNGRVITLYDAAGQPHPYAITEFLRLKDTGVPVEQRIANARFMLPTGEAQLTIITCWPPTNNTHRLIVIAKPAQ